MRVAAAKGDGARRRRRRAAAAAQLLALHEQGALDDPARWDWRTLGELPSWCLAAEEERRRLQAACGLVFLGPMLGASIDGAALRAAGDLVGTPALEAILDDALERFGRTPGTEASADGEEASDRPSPVSPAVTLGGTDEEIAARLLGTGAAVLYATLTERLEHVLPLEALRTALGPALGELEPAVAEPVLERAIRLSAGPGTGVAAAPGVGEESGERFAPGSGA